MFTLTTDETTGLITLQLDATQLAAIKHRHETLDEIARSWAETFILPEVTYVSQEAAQSVVNGGIIAGPDESQALMDIMANGKNAADSSKDLAVNIIVSQPGYANKLIRNRKEERVRLLEEKSRAESSRSDAQSKPQTPEVAEDIGNINVRIGEIDIRLAEIANEIGE